MVLMSSNATLVARSANRSAHVMMCLVCETLLTSRWSHMSPIGVTTENATRLLGAGERVCVILRGRQRWILGGRRHRRRLF